MRDVNSLKKQIDEVAKQATNGILPAGYQDKTYIKGRYAGNQKPYWDIDGEAFNRLWKLIEPYVRKSVNSSAYYSKPEEREDFVAEIRAWTYRVLRNYGPCPNGQPFHKQVPLTVNNALTNFRRLSKSPSKRLNYEAISLFQTMQGSEDPIVNTLTDEDTTSVAILELTLHLPPTTQKIVRYFLRAGKSAMKDTCERFGLSRKQLLNILESCIL